MPLPQAIASMEVAWRMAMQVEATKPSHDMAHQHPHVDGVLGTQQLRPHWWDAVTWAQRIVEAYPTHPQALVVLAEAQWAHGYRERALLLLTQAWNLTTPSRALTERVRQWLQTLGLAQELAEFDRVTVRKKLHSQARSTVEKAGRPPS